VSDIAPEELANHAVRRFAQRGSPVPRRDGPRKTCTTPRVIQVGLPVRDVLWRTFMIRTSLLVTVLAASCVLGGCSADDGKPSGSGTGTGTGGGTGTGTGTPAATDTTRSPTAPAPAEAGAKKGLTEICATNDDCASGVCYASDQGALYCSVKCTADNATTVCVAPLAGSCNKKGYCKKP